MIISATSKVGIKTFIISCQQDVVPHCANNLDYIILQLSFAFLYEIQIVCLSDINSHLEVHL